MKNPKLQRWAMIVSEMGGHIRYFPRKDNECADMLSRLRSSSPPMAETYLEVLPIAVQKPMPFVPVRCLAAMTSSSISTIDTGEWVAADFPEGDEVERIPLEADGLTKDRVCAEQLVKFEEYFKLAREDDSEYAVIDGLLYSVKRPTKFDVIYPRLVLPPCF